MGIQKSGAAPVVPQTVKKVHCRGEHCSPVPVCSVNSLPGKAPAAANGHGLAPASAETKEKPLAERIGKGLSLVRGTGLEPVTSCTSSRCSTS